MFQLSKKAEHTELIRRQEVELKQMGIKYVNVTETQRCWSEMFRFGDSFNNQLVSQKGMLTSLGVDYAKAWLFTQIADFPGDRSLGIRTVHSRVVVPDRSRVLGAPQRVPAHSSPRRSSGQSSGLGGRVVHERDNRRHQPYNRQGGRSRSGGIPNNIGPISPLRPSSTSLGQERRRH